MNPCIVRDIAARISEASLENLTERKDKFISNVYKLRIDAMVLGKEDSDKKKHQRLQTKLQFNATG